MKKIILSVLIPLVVNCVAYTQPVIHNILFDNYTSPSNNDFVNHFTGGPGLTQISTNGISGGCLTTPNTESWGNDNAIYCSRYIDSASYSSSTSISFKYDSTQLNAINFDRAVSVFLRPNADFNHYIIASITSDKKIQIVSYFAANNPFAVNLIHNHWYNFILNTAFITPAPVYQVSVNAQLNDLGLTGLNPPIPAGNSNLSFNDSLLYVDTSVQVSFSGTLWGGASYLDNFHFEGMKSADSCSSVTGIPLLNSDEVNVIITDNTINITHAREGSTLQLYSVSGQKILSRKIPSGQSSFPVSDLENGFYILKISENDDRLNLTKKFVIIK